MRFVAILWCVLLLSACAAGPSLKKPTMIRFDNETQYSIDQEPNGFYIKVYYSSSQLIPKSEDVIAVCREQVKAVAAHHASTQSRGLEPLENKKIRVSLERNGFSGIINCTGHTHALFMKKGW